MLDFLKRYFCCLKKRSLLDLDEEFEHYDIYEDGRFIRNNTTYI